MVTWLPTDTTISFGLTPLDVMVIIFVAVGVVDGDVGEDEEDDPPHATASPASATAMHAAVA